MKIRKVILSLAGAGGLLLAATTAASAANPPPNPPSAGFPTIPTGADYPGYSSNPAPFLSTGGVTPDSIGAGSWVMSWLPNENYSWSNGNGGPYWNLLNGNWTTVDALGGSWSLLKDNNTGLCITWDGGPNTLYEKVCNASKPSEQWASSAVPGTVGTGSFGEWYFWNRYLKEIAPDDCGNTDAPVVTDNSSGGDLVLECPENGPTSYSQNQAWQISENGGLP